MTLADDENLTLVERGLPRQSVEREESGGGDAVHFGDRRETFAGDNGVGDVSEDTGRIDNAMEMNMRSDIQRRLSASLRFDAVNGTQQERRCSGMINHLRKPISPQKLLKHCLTLPSVWSDCF